MSIFLLKRTFHGKRKSKVVHYLLDRHRILDNCTVSIFLILSLVTISAGEKALAQSEDERHPKGDSVNITVQPIEIDPQEPVVMTVASSISPSGRLVNATSEFSETRFNFSDNDNSRSITLQIVPGTNLMPGDYTLTVGARHGSVTYSKLLNLTVR